jgi:hypothetical protein
MTYQDPVGLAAAGAGSGRLKAAITARSVQLIRSRGVSRCSAASWRRRTRISISLAVSERVCRTIQCRSFASIR